MPIQLVILDCDLTLWDDHDVTSLSRPFRKAGPDRVLDAEGRPVTLYPGTRAAFDGLRARGVLISASTWNQPEPVFEIFELLEIRPYFTHPQAEHHPHKDRMIQRILDELAREGRPVAVENALYVDDRRIHLAEIYRNVGPIRFLQFGVDITDLRQVLDIVDRAAEVEARTPPVRV